jgi:hypothetical protein
MANRAERREKRLNINECQICGLTNIRVEYYPILLCIHENGWNYTTNINWAYQNKLREEWLANNPDAEYQGWMSI